MLKQKKIDICLLQETYCTPKVENMWRNEWGGKIFFSNGSNHARGVAVLIKPGFHAEILNDISDNIGRMLLLEIKIQDTPFKLINIYAPNSELGQFHFYHYLKNFLQTKVDSRENILIGGDFNIILDKDLDRKGGARVFSFKHDDIIKIIKDILSFFFS